MLYVLIVGVNSVVMYISFVYYTCGFPLCLAYDCCGVLLVLWVGVVAFW